MRGGRGPSRAHTLERYYAGCDAPPAPAELHDACDTIAANARGLYLYAATMRRMLLPDDGNTLAPDAPRRGLPNVLTDFPRGLHALYRRYLERVFERMRSGTDDGEMPVRLLKGWAAIVLRVPAPPVVR